MNRVFTYWLGMILMIMLPTAVAQAHGVGVNFVGKPAHSLAPTDVAGVVAQKNWNNLHIDSSDPNGHSNGGELHNLINDRGAVVKGLGIVVEGTPNSGIWGNAGATWGFTGADLTLQQGTIWPHPHVKITGIPYPKYDVYVYISAGGNGGLAKVHIAVPGGKSGVVDSHSTYFCKFGWTGGNFVRATATSLSAAKASKPANYVEFTGNTAPGVDLNCNGALAGWIGFSGIQIVPVVMPTVASTPIAAPTVSSPVSAPAVSPASTPVANAPAAGWSGSELLIGVIIGALVVLLAVVANNLTRRKPGAK